MKNTNKMPKKKLMSIEELEAFKMIQKYNKARRFIEDDLKDKYETVHMYLKDVVKMLVEFKSH